MISSKDIVTDVARSGARVFQYHTVVNWKDTDGTIPPDGNTVGMVGRLTTPIRIGAGAFISPTRMGSQGIFIPSGSIGLQEVRNAQPLDTSIHGISSKHRYPAPTFSKVIGCRFSDKYRTYIYLRFHMNLTRDSVLAKSPKFMNLGLSSVHTLDKLMAVFIPTTSIGMPADGSNWIPPGNIIGEVTADRVIKLRLEQNYSAKTGLETRRGNQDLGRQNNYMSRPPLDSDPLGTNTNTGTTSPIESIPVGTKMPEPTPMTPPIYLPTLTTDLPEQNGKTHIPGDPDPDPSSSYSSSNKSNLSNDSNSSK